MTPRVATTWPPLAALFAALLIPGLGRAQGPAGSDLAFLEVGRSYLITFPPGASPFEVRETEVTTVQAESRNADGTGDVRKSTIPTTMTMWYRIDVFVVRRLGGGSWALLEHPADAKAAMQTTTAKLVLANKALVAEKEKSEEGRKQLEQYRADARREVKTTQTWVNLAHAVTIADPPAETTEPPRIKVEIKDARE
jgi:hypothetical protein